MNHLSLRSDLSKSSSGERIVERFWKELATGQVHAARKRVCPDFRWFGRAITAADWTGPALRTFLGAETLELVEVRALSSEVLARIPEAARTRIFGVLEPGDRIFFADLRRVGTAFTALVVLGDARGEGLLRSVQDPSDFVRFTRLLGAID